MNNYPGQICQDEEINKEFDQLHHEIVDKIIQFCNKHKLDIDEVTLSIDSMACSIPYDQWQACTDSSLSMWSIDDEEPFLWSI